MNDLTEMELPRYTSHKKVWALKIASIEYQVDEDGSAMIVPADDRYSPFKVSFDYVHHRGPEPGGYYVRYEDGYESYSPAEAFENGYRKD